jgi:hypothetical protein
MWCVCWKGFSYRTSPVWHIKEHIQIKSPSIALLVETEITFLSHQRIHTRDAQITCIICEKWLSDNGGVTSQGAFEIHCMWEKLCTECISGVTWLVKVSSQASSHLIRVLSSSSLAPLAQSTAQIKGVWSCSSLLLYATLVFCLRADNSTRAFKIPSQPGECYGRMIIGMGCVFYFWLLFRLLPTPFRLLSTPSVLTNTTPWTGSYFPTSLVFLVVCLCGNFCQTFAISFQWMHSVVYHILFLSGNRHNTTIINTCNSIQ